MFLVVFDSFRLFSVVFGCFRCFYGPSGCLKWITEFDSISNIYKLTGKVFFESPLKYNNIC